MPGGLVTVALGLYKHLGLPLPPTRGQATSSWILVYGGSSATGTLAIQFAKLYVQTGRVSIYNTNLYKDRDSKS